MCENTKLTLDWDDVILSSENNCDQTSDPCIPIADALHMSLANKGRIDMRYIQVITGKSLEMIVETLGEAVYQNPETWQENPEMGWETSEEYLSGNIYKKLTAASNANKQYKCFDRNIKALSLLLPDFVQPENVYVTLGSPWVPAHVIDDFIEHLFASAFNRSYALRVDHRVKHDEFGWEIPFKNRYGHSVLVTKTYGTSRLNALRILEMTLNTKAAVVYDEVDSPTTMSGTARVLNEEETMMAIEKQQLMVREFKDWVWKDAGREKELMDIFESKYACNRKRIFNGSYLTFPGLSEDVTLYPYQKNAVSRILLTPNTLLAHEVGSGKTYIMIGAGMEAKRLGLSKKNMYVVPNSVVGQWKDLFYKMYPKANILCVEPRSFIPAKRQKVLEQIRDNNYDGIIIAYSCFDSISLSRDHYMQTLQEEKAKLEQMANNRSKATTAVKAKLRAVSEKLSKMAVQGNQDKGLICFDELGITRLFIDEAHNFKNVPLETRTNLAKGIYAAGSKKCQHMLDKVRFVQQQNNGGGVVMATGTPITNSVSDIYIMQKYLQSGELALLDLQTFDSWIGMFAERSTEFEIDVDTNSYKLTNRYSTFHNLPELTSMVSSFTDFHKTYDSEDLPVFQEYTDISVPKSAALRVFLEDISVRADDVRRKRVRRTEDNLLKITMDGRKAALSMKLIDEEFTSMEVSKVSACAKQVADLYFTVPDRRTQLIFCDISTPKEGFNIYDEMKTSLILQGIPGSEIAYIHDADSEAKRELLFRKFRNGDIRILIGSTFKLGLGVNIQERLAAVHHLDVPWRPADMTQREGRIIRQGNTCEEIRIFRYYTEGSFDAYSWQLLETKQRFINDLLSGEETARSADDIKDTVLSYAEIKALSIGNPLLKERCEVSNELYRYRTIIRKEAEAHSRMETRLSSITDYIRAQKEGLISLEADLEKLKVWDQEHQLCSDKKARKKEKAERKRFCNLLDKAIQNNLLRSKERYYGPYKCFHIILPADMTEENPYIWLKGKSRYQVPLGIYKERYLAMVDVFLGNLERSYLKRQEDISEKSIEALNVINELNKQSDYEDKIMNLKKRLEGIDRALDGKKNGE